MNWNAISIVYTRKKKFVSLLNKTKIEFVTKYGLPIDAASHASIFALFIRFRWKKIQAYLKSFFENIYLGVCGEDIEKSYAKREYFSDIFMHKLNFMYEVERVSRQACFLTFQGKFTQLLTIWSVSFALILKLNVD